MKITPTRLKEIIKEEMTRLKELGSETGHAEGTDAAGVVRQIATDLEEVAGVMNSAPSTTTASEFAGFIQAKATELTEAADELSLDGPRPVAEGDDHSRTITQIETIGDVVVEVVGMIENPEAIERLERVDSMITDLLSQMQGVEPAPAADGYSNVAGQRPMQEAPEGYEGREARSKSVDPKIGNPVTNLGKLIEDALAGAQMAVGDTPRENQRLKTKLSDIQGKLQDALEDMWEL